MLFFFLFLGSSECFASIFHVSPSLCTACTFLFDFFFGVMLLAFICLVFSSHSPKPVSLSLSLFQSFTLVFSCCCCCRNGRNYVKRKQRSRRKRSVRKRRKGDGSHVLVDTQNFNSLAIPLTHQLEAYSLYIIPLANLGKQFYNFYWKWSNECCCCHDDNFPPRRVWLPWLLQIPGFFLFFFCTCTGTCMWQCETGTLQVWWGMWWSQWPF